MRIFSRVVMSVGVVGASGYAGGELLRLLAGHPEFELSVAAANTAAGVQITSVHPGLGSLSGEVFSHTDPDELGELDLVFVALPHGESSALTAALPADQYVVDLGADHRLHDPAAWDRYYGAATRSEPWTYGLPELPGRRKELAGSRKVAVAGCYATAIQLSLAPALCSQLVEPADIVVAAASGTSGAGRKATVALSATEVMGTLSAYKVGGSHQHTAEIEQELSALSSGAVTLSFTPFLAPMPRGILATSTARLAQGANLEWLVAAYASAYKGEPFVRLLDAGTTPTTAAVLGSNTATLQVFADEHAGRAVIVAAIDNLTKGAAGQAIQCANIMVGLAEASGLNTDGMTP